MELELTWRSLQKKLKHIIITAGGPTRTSSGNLEVIYHFDGSISVGIDARDITSWPTYAEIGIFTSEIQAMTAVFSKLEEAEKEITLELNNCCVVCESDLTFDGFCENC